jgi:hypothetical protein
MPIVVDEVLITVEVDNQGAAAAAPAAGAAPPAAAGAPSDKQALVAECVERVLDILAERREP